MGSLDAALGALAGLGIEHLPEPVDRAVVDGLRNVEAEVETAMVGSTEHQHKLTLFVLHLGDLQFGVLALDVVRIYERGLVAKEGVTLAKVLRELLLRFLLQQMPLAFGDAVPELGFSLVKEIDSRQIQVLFVPAEEGLPGPDVAVGSVDPADSGFHGVTKQGVEVSEVPTGGLVVHEGVEEVGSVEGRGEDDVLPELSERECTICSTWSVVRSLVILSKTPVFIWYSSKVMDFFWMCMHSYTPPLPKIFCSIGPFTFRCCRLSA